ncbi:hypothetical protein N7U66_03700 [Lacinutrix neustonica]|uniref:Metallophosphoesterase n=1 Tax=Lacinutrix neustonica TaxID=2980107 RepID=A0A9E8SDT9_9FLAO|nr:hypothetical protein [Lacinutrix neustonica]WAC02778.1 hypothetical protein N7U66_03700 [Lacinutrix neustonica]
MRSFSIYTILLLCLAILVVDAAAYYWLGSITALVSATLQQVINILFWIFSIGLMAAIIVLKIRLDDIDPKRKQILINSLYGLTVSSFIPKLLFIIVISILYSVNYVISEESSLFIVPLVGLFSGFLPFFVILYGVVRTVYLFEVYHIKIKFKNLPKAFHGLRIVHISDSHLGSFNARYHIFDKAITKINQLKPRLHIFHRRFSK